MNHASDIMKFSSGISLLRPLLALVLAAATVTVALHEIAGGQEIADDILVLARFVQDPFVLWGDYRAANLSDTWGSFPPLFPLVFSALARPWLGFLPEFWGFRLGVLCWSIVAMIALWALLSRFPEIPDSRRRQMLTCFALFPSVIATIALIPEEEIYVSLFAVALFAAVASKRWRLVPLALIAAALAGKYFLLVLVVPAALLSPTPKRNLVGWSALSVATLAAYLGYHLVRHGFVPIAGYLIDPSASISVWALTWNLGWTPSARIIQFASLGLVVIFALLFSLRAIHRGRPAVNVLSGTIVGTILLLTVSVPGYILWALPLVLVSIGLMAHRRDRIVALLSLFLWGVAEWGANFSRGVLLALSADRPAGKETIAAFATRILGSDFPFHAVHILCLCVVIGSGVTLLFALSTSSPLDRVAPERY